MTRYRPTFRKQLDGSRCAGDNCNCAVHAMLIDYETQGACQPTPAAVRNKITPTACGGTNNEQNEAALRSLCGPHGISARYNVPFEDAVDLVRAGRAGEFTIQYSALKGTKYDSCSQFFGRHATGVFDATDTQGLVGDPLADGRVLRDGRTAVAGFQWWPLELLKKACGAAGTPGLVDACDFTRDIVPEPIPPEEAEMLPVTDPAPKLLAVAKGAAVLNLDATPLTTFSNDYSGVESPFGTTVSGKTYRTAYVSVGGVRQLTLVPVAVATDPPPVDPAALDASYNAGVDAASAKAKEAKKL